MRFIGPKNRLARREGQDLGLKTAGSKSQANLLRRINIRPGQKANARYKKYTEYGLQLREKQKIRRMYGITETQLAKYFELANHHEGNTAHMLVSQLETRLDNVVYKLGFAPTRASARQLVNHGHVAVNDKKISIPSYQVSEGDRISFNKVDTTKIPYIQTFMERKDHNMPKWLERKAIIGKVIGMADPEVLSDDIDLQAVIEFYSR